jgi:hypothetical protein
MSRGSAAAEVVGLCRARLTDRPTQVIWRALKRDVCRTERSTVDHTPAQRSAGLAQVERGQERSERERIHNVHRQTREMLCKVPREMLSVDTQKMLWQDCREIELTSLFLKL